jgi:uncharacterized membrane protein
MGPERKGPTIGKGRLESLTDGVFAIIMTILVFNISVPESYYSKRESTHQRGS